MDGFMNIYFLFFLSLISFVNCRNHIINIKNDNRQSILLSNFGYNPNAFLYLNIKKISVASNDSLFGFSMYRSLAGSVSSYVESSSKICLLHDHKFNSMMLIYNQNNHTMTVETNGQSMAGLLIYKGIGMPLGNNSTQLGKFNMTKEVQTRLNNHLVKLFAYFIDNVNATQLANQTSQAFKESLLITPTERKAVLNIVEMNPVLSARDNPNVVSDIKMILITAKKVLGDSFTKKMATIWSELQAPITFHIDLPLQILIQFPTSNEEGEYDLYFHNCATPKKVVSPVNIAMDMVEKNWNSYLSAGDQPLPLLFFILCSAYIILTMIWGLTLFTSEHMIFKIHYLMMTLLIMKSLTLFFHGINYYELGRNGVPEQGWAIMYYITHLLKGALLFTTIILIGAGWAFIKHMLTGKEKKIFIIVIPLQILANVAAIIIDETEESTVRYRTWRNIFLLVDLICCGAILFPVIWSIKHLKEAANIDGKQTQNLQKLRLFRHFYILIICYIYFTRIIVYLLVITVSFKLSWTVDLFRELSTVVFMIVTGYKFRPASDNPYLLVPFDEDDVTEEEQMEHAWSQSGITDGVMKINQLSKLDSDDSDDDDTVYEKSPRDTHKNPSLNINNGFIHTSQL